MQVRTQAHILNRTSVLYFDAVNNKHYALYKNKVYYGQGISFRAKQTST